MLIAQKILLRAKVRIFETQGLRDGRLLHLVLEPEKWDKFIFVDVAIKTKHIKRRRTRRCLYSKEKEDAERLADALLKNDKAQHYFTNHNLKSRDRVINDYLFRGKADIITKSGGIGDIKTTTDIKGGMQLLNTDMKFSLYLLPIIQRKLF